MTRMSTISSAEHCKQTFKMIHMSVFPVTPTGQYDSSLPSRRSRIRVSSTRAQTAAKGARNLGRMLSTPEESYIAGA